jgi:hypothetical protein
MSKDDKLKSSEIVVRVIVRLPDELKTRPSQDTEDFLRKKDYKGTGLPENGLSFLRKSILQTPADLYGYKKQSMSDVINASILRCDNLTLHCVR